MLWTNNMHPTCFILTVELWGVSLLNLWWQMTTNLCLQTESGPANINRTLVTQSIIVSMSFNTLRPWQDGRHFPDDILKCIFVNWNVWMSLAISLKYVWKVRINNIPSLVQIMAWRRRGDKPLSEPMMVSLLTPICVTRPQWVKKLLTFIFTF